jgi:hypothetical protein
VAVATRAALLLALLASAPAAPAGAQYLNAYKDGLAAIEARDWDRAARLMAEAIADRDEEKLKLPGRLFMRPYVPHFYLGMARFEAGDCAGAIAAWAESDRQGVLAKLPEADVARRGREECADRARRRDLAQARQEARSALSAASVPAAALLDLARDDHTRDVWRQGSPSPADRHAEGLELMRQARELLADESVDEDGIARAEGLVRDASAVFEAVRSDVERLTEERRLLVAEKDKGIESRVAQARDVLAKTAYLAPYPRLVRKARADLEGLVQESQRRDSTSQAHLDGLAARLENSTRDLQRLATAPPQTLDDAAEAFLGGRHADVVAKLADASFGERRTRAHARLLLAASRHALYLEGGELDPELRAAAAEDARACRDNDPRLAPKDRFFSPRFIAFFAESVAAAASGAGAPQTTR